MRYQFTPANRAGATTIVFANHRVSFIPGVGELDDDVWNDIKDDSTIVEMLEAETLRALTSSPVTPPAPATPKTTKPTKPE
ncbi:MAG: hypothetical protein KME27_10615 [Lyngbya sp. HA4199-MV5]|jgi:hypothetical protein|nr:hypothetical protein [Lyngbya sp. HA4199-MV5]